MLADKTNYLNKEIQYLKNVEISEWDIKSAGFSVLKYKKLLPEETLTEWSKLDKQTRTVKEGLLQKNNPLIAEEIINTLAEIRNSFVSINNIDDSSILSIKKDALFLINQHPEKNIIKDLFEFRKKNVYTSYMYINKKEFYYSSRTNELDVKGISDKVKEKQKDFFLKDISNILRSGEKVQQDQMYLMLKTYRKKYLNRELPLETYRELDSGMFRLGDYTLEDINESLRDSIDITQNYINYVVPLIQALL